MYHGPFVQDQAFSPSRGEPSVLESDDLTMEAVVTIGS